MRYTLFLVLMMSFCSFNAQKNLIPKPQSIEISSGFYSIPKNIKINSNTKDLKKILFEMRLFNNRGISFSKSNSAKNNQIYFQILKKTNQTSSEDYYRIEVLQSKILVSSYTEKGRFYAINSLMNIFDEYIDEGRIPCFVIKDFPKFSWRGMHLDVGRHFFTKDEIKKYIDYLAMYKFNTFHWHLTEDQGWRIEIKKFPKLTEIGAFRNGTMIGRYKDQKFDSIKYGGFYTQEEIKEVVKYAAERHITIVPEIEMPGHAVAAIASYPFLSCTGKQIEVEKMWGVFDDVFCPKEEIFTFLEDVLTEVIDLFPSKIIHIGGDEVPKTRWKNCPHCQALIKKEGLKDEHELQSYFIQRIEKFLNSKGRKIIGWDEILEGGLAPNAAVMSWRGKEGGIVAAKQKHDVVMTPAEFCYLNRYQGLPKNEPLASGGYITLEKVYQFNPIPESLSKDEQKYIIGAQGSIWTEYIKNFDYIEYMIFPRIMALSEVVWGTSQPSQFSEFQKRVSKHMKILDDRGIRYSRSMYNVEAETVIPKDKKDAILLELKGFSGIDKIYYTTDGKEPNIYSTKYKEPIPINKNTTIKAAYFDDEAIRSNILEQQVFVSKSTGKKISLDVLPQKKYFVKGPETLVDGIKGNPSDFTQNWLGFVSDINVVIDFPEETEISNLKINFVNSQTDWIHLPKKIAIRFFELLKNGQKNSVIIEIPKEIIEKNNGVISTDFTKKYMVNKVEIEIQNSGIIADGLDGAGNIAWLFIDEISIN